MKKTAAKKLNFILVTFCLLCRLLVPGVKAATSWYFHENGTSPGFGIVANTSYSWEDAVWTTSSTGLGTGQVTYATALTASAGNGGVFPRFNSTTTPYTITVPNSENMSGMFGASAVTITFNQSGSGSINVVPNASLQAGLPAQGFFTGGGNLIINCPITGTGAVGENSGGGNLELFGNNTYSGGTVFNSSGTLTYFNNNNSFGTGPIVINGTTFAPILGTGGATITLANNWTNLSAAGVNFAADPNTPVILSGPVRLLANLNLRNNGGGGTSPLTLSGVISGSGGLNLTANNGSTITLSGNNTFTGQTTIGIGGSASTTVTVLINSLKNLSTSCSLGAPTTTAAGTIGMGSASVNATLIYNGSGDTCNRVIDLSGSGSPVGNATLEADGSGALVLSGNVTASGAAAKTLTLQGTSTALNTIGGAIADNSLANPTSLVKAQAGTWKLTGNSTFTGGTTVSAGTLEVSGQIKSVTVTGGVLQLDNTTALSPSATLTASSSLANSVNLNYSGFLPVTSLIIDGTPEPANSTWGATGSGAANTSPAFSGSGIIIVSGSPVIVQEPQSLSVYPNPPSTNVATFSVSVVGDPSFTYQWYVGASAISGANSSSYTVPQPFGPAAAGSYSCAITNNFGHTNTSAATLTVLATNSYVNAVIGSLPTAFWRLDETSGTTAFDYIGGNNGTYNNATIPDNAGYASPIDTDGCMGVPNNGSPRGYMQANNATPFILSGAGSLFTLEAWVNPTNLTTKGRLFSTLSLTAPNGYAFGYLPGGNVLEFTAGAVADVDTPTLSTPLVAGQWYHLVCVYDGNFYNFYVNGAPVGQVAIAGHAVNGTQSKLQLGANPPGYVTGGSDGGAEQVYGRIDEAAFYTVALSPADVTNHFAQRYGSLQPPIPSAPSVVPGSGSSGTNYQSLSATFIESAAGIDLSYQWYKAPSTLLSGSTASTMTLGNLQAGDAGSYYCQVSNPAGISNSPNATLTVLPIPTSAAQVHLTNGLVLHLPFDNDYKDISGRGHNGTAQGAPTFVAGQIGANALHYSTSSGSTNYVTLGVVSDLKFGASTDFSVSYWVRQPASSVYTNLPFFGDAIGSTSLGNAGFALAPYQQDAVPTGGGWMVGMSDGTHAMTSPSQFTTFNDINTINDGNWHHLVHVFSRASSVATYLDGTQVDSEAISFIVNINNNNAATIGQDPTGAYRVPDGTQADLDDLGVWTRALTSLEVSGAYLAGSSNHVSFAAAGLAPVTISTQLAVGNTSLSYTGGAGSQFVLLGTTVVTTPAASWTRIATNSSTPGSFTIPPIGTGTAQYYRVKSE